MAEGAAIFTAQDIPVVEGGEAADLGCVVVAVHEHAAWFLENLEKDETLVAITGSVHEHADEPAGLSAEKIEVIVAE